MTLFDPYATFDDPPATIAQLVNLRRRLKVYIGANRCSVSPRFLTARPPFRQRPTNCVDASRASC